MKTLLISGIYRPEIGGPATYIPALASEIQTQSGSVEVVTLKHSSATELNEPWPIKYVNRDQFLLLRFIKTYFCIKSRIKLANLSSRMDCFKKQQSHCLVAKRIHWQK